jgi:hypothetical protein
MNEFFWCMRPQQRRDSSQAFQQCVLSCFRVDCDCPVFVYFFAYKDDLRTLLLYLNCVCLCVHQRKKTIAKPRISHSLGTQLTGHYIIYPCKWSE